MHNRIELAFINLYIKLYLSHSAHYLTLMHICIRDRLIKYAVLLHFPHHC